MLGGKKLYRMLKPDLKKMGMKLRRDNFFNILRKQGLLIYKKKRFTKTTNSFHGFRIYDNFVLVLRKMEFSKFDLGRFSYSISDFNSVFSCLL